MGFCSDSVVKTMGDMYLVRQVNPDSYMLCKPLLPAMQEKDAASGGDGFNKQGKHYTFLSLLYRIQTAKEQGDKVIAPEKDSELCEIVSQAAKILELEQEIRRSVFDKSQAAKAAGTKS